ncbi:MAG: sigma-54 dependent transcriptional regulator [Planctomycetota bacterium]
MIVTQSPKMRNLIQFAKRVALSNASILLTGESGTGKELFAQLIHKTSRRSSGAFVKVNCAALPENLIESELFGHEKGSFTDAVQARAGRFEMANGGTLLLDEISETGLTTQAKLLRVLEQSEYERVGGDQTLRSDVRVIATSNRELEEEVGKKQFRLDLFHRLNVIRIQIPALRERPEDITILAMHFLKRFQDENEIPLRGFSTQAFKLLAKHDWPGNVRELRNVIHRACVLSTSPLIGIECIEPLRSSGNSEPGLPEEWLQMKLAELEKRIILAAIEKYGTKRVAAEKLGVSPRTLSNKIRIYRETNDQSEAA